MYAVISNEKIHRVIPNPVLKYQIENLKSLGFKIDMTGTMPECRVRRLELDGKLWP